MLWKCSGTHSTQTAVRSPLSGKQAQCFPSLCLPCGMMCKTQLCSFSGKTWHENKAQPLLGRFGESPSLGVSRQSPELFVCIESSEGSLRDLPCRSQTPKHRPGALQRHLPQQVWPQLTDKQEGEGGREDPSLRAAAKLPPAGKSSKETLMSPLTHTLAGKGGDVESAQGTQPSPTGLTKGCSTETILAG